MTPDTPPDSPHASVASDFRALFTEHYSYVFHSLRRLGVEGSDLPDLTHEVFMAAHQRFATFDGARPLRPWLFGIAFRVVSNYRRAPSRRHDHAAIEDVDLVDERVMLDEQIATRQAQDLVQRALQALEPDKRAVLILHEIDEQSIPEIAGALEIPLNTAYSRLRLARVLFAKALARETARQR